MYVAITSPYLRDQGVTQILKEISLRCFKIKKFILKFDGLHVVRSLKAKQVNKHFVIDDRTTVNFLTELDRTEQFCSADYDRTFLYMFDHIWSDITIIVQASFAEQNYFLNDMF